MTCDCIQCCNLLLVLFDILQFMERNDQAYFMVLPKFCQEELRKIIQHLREKNQYSGLYLNTLPPETKLGMLTTQWHDQFIC